MLDNLKKYRLILASNSPRRKELLAGLGLDYEVRTLPDVDESYPESLQGGDIPLYISRMKADAYKPMLQPDELMITADTIVWMDGMVLGKPRNKLGAIEMLRQLSGGVHYVYTGVSITTQTRQESFYVATEVRFANLTDEEIEYYVDTYQPMDKAGAYGVGNNIQVGWSNFSAVLVHRYVCCDCGYSEEWIDREDIPALKKKYK